MLRPTRLFAVALLALAALRADESLAHARRAQLLLGAETWSRLIRIENRATESRYPREVHALVFELAGLLWFYTDADGTQSFSLHRNRLAEEKADFAPLLRDIEPGFARWTPIAAGEADAAVAQTTELTLPNGCFVESVAALRTRVLTGAPTRNARLISYHVATPEGLQGHTVLVYEARRGVEIIDPARPERVFTLPREHASDPLTLARAFEGADVERARELPLAVSARPAIARL